MGTSWPRCNLMRFSFFFFFFFLQVFRRNQRERSKWYSTVLVNYKMLWSQVDWVLWQYCGRCGAVSFKRRGSPFSNFLKNFLFKEEEKKNIVYSAPTADNALGPSIIPHHLPLFLFCFLSWGGGCNLPFFACLFLYIRKDCEIKKVPQNRNWTSYLKHQHCHGEVCFEDVSIM